MTTLIAIRHCQIGDRNFAHGEELPPGLLPREVVDRWLDEGSLKEYDTAERRSLYRLFAPFSGVKEREPLSRNELTELTVGD